MRRNLDICGACRARAAAGKLGATLTGEEVCLSPFTVGKEVFYDFKPCEKNPNQNIGFLKIKKVEV